MQVTRTGSVRVDLVGGTLDLEPINLILPNVVTLNVATSLKAEVSIERSSGKDINIFSDDYQKEYIVSLSDLTYENLYQSNKFMEMTFLLQIIDYLKVDSGLNIKLKSGAPAGSGLGGSSAMGMTFFSTLCDLLGISFTLKEKIATVKAIEARILGQGVTGYQDYYPALTGGVLGLVSRPGEVFVDQLYTKELAHFLNEHVSLIFSGISRDSGINNWEVYKSFFDGDENVQNSMAEIARLSFETYESIKNKEFIKILSLIGEEGHARQKLSLNIVPEKVQKFYNEIKAHSGVKGMKMCGAGGGGCFIVTHEKDQSSYVKEQASLANFKVLDFEVVEPLDE